MNQYVLSVNAGSSSLKFRLYQMPKETVLLSGQFDGIHSDKMVFVAKHGTHTSKIQLANKDFEFSANFLLQYMLDNKIVASFEAINIVGHRVAHGGDKFDDAVTVTDSVLLGIDDLCSLAPLHNPNNLLCIKIFQNALPIAKQVAVFDTAFHQTMSNETYLYPLPYELYEKHRIRKFGFHGISHQYVGIVLKEEYSERKNLKVINCHLGNGASICAMLDGLSVDTSMGFTPLSGLMMGTRCGDIDPALPAYISEVTGKGIQAVVKMMNFESGVLGISQLSNDFRLIVDATKEGDLKAALALKMFINRVVKFIGSYAAVLNGIDVLSFTGGIGENSDHIRSEVCKNLKYLGLELDQKANKSNASTISSALSKVVVQVINTDEELMIARDSCRITSSL